MTLGDSTAGASRSRMPARPVACTRNCAPDYARRTMRAGLCAPDYARRTMRAGLCAPDYALRTMRTGLCAPDYARRGGDGAPCGALGQACCESQQESRAVAPTEPAANRVGVQGGEAMGGGAGGALAKTVRDAMASTRRPKSDPGCGSKLRGARARPIGPRPGRRGGLGGGAPNSERRRRAKLRAAGTGARTKWRVRRSRNPERSSGRVGQVGLDRALGARMHRQP